MLILFREIGLGSLSTSGFVGYFKIRFLSYTHVFLPTYQR